MAARLRKTHQDDIRSKIQVSNLITRLMKYAMGELSDEDISPNRLNAIKLLLSKTLPDLQSIEHTGKDGSDLMKPVDDMELARQIAFVLQSAVHKTEESHTTH
jgi:hypothetical protein